MSKKKTSIWADNEFVKMLRDMYPNQKSDYFRTKMMKNKMEKMLYNKKGSMFDLVFIMTTMFLIFIVIILVGLAYSQSNTVIQGMDNIPTEAKDSYNNLASKYPRQMDNAFLIVFVGLCVISFILAALVSVNIMFLPIYLISIIFMLIQAGIIANIYDKMSKMSILAVEIAKYSNSKVIFTWFPWLIFIMSLGLMFVMYKINPPQGA